MSALAFFIILTGTLPESIRGDLEFIAAANPIVCPAAAEDTISFSSRLASSEIRMVMTGLIGLYQTYVSPQGPPGCNFTLTCSHFMSEAVCRYGLFFGLLMTADRLERCVKVTPPYYPIDPVTGRAVDYPVESYYWFTRRRGHD